MATTTPLHQPITPSKPITTETSLKGRWLTLARVGWIVIIAAAVVQYIYLIYLETITDIPHPTGSGIIVNSLFILIGVHIIVPLGYLIMALLIFWRKSNDWMALLVSLMLGLTGVHIMSGSHEEAMALPALTVPNLFLLSLGIICMVLVVFLFPDGRFRPNWLRWPALLGTAAMILSVIVLPAPYFVPGTDLSTYVLGLLVMLAIGIGAQIYRYRRVFNAAQRQQTKWVVLGFSAIIVTIIVYATLYPLNPALFNTAGPGSYILMPIFLTLLLILPAGFLLAMLRYRLWDVDFIINRTLVYGAVTVFLLLDFVVTFFILRWLLQLVLGPGQEVIAAILPTALTVGLFNPARRRFRDFVDRRFYGINVDYATPPSPPPAAPTSDLSSRTSVGPYAGLIPIGSGGMAQVYKALHPTLNRAVAIKVLPAHLAKEDQFRRRFEREAQVVAKLKHPNIVQMHDYGVSEGTYYMVMEFVEGHDLSDRLHERKLSVKETAAILNDVAGALDYAHTQGLVHRDIKPSNVMLERITAAGDGRVQRAVLMDFGIARITGGASRLTSTGVMGTFDYMSPEQIKDARDVDGRADLYALGVMAYQMLTGEPPFKATNPAALLLAHLNQPAPDPRSVRRELSSDVAHAVLKALEKDPLNRWSTAGEFAAALQQAETA